ncbi:UBX-domain containing protein [Coccidioides posadasii C735 delta SOWgp]|uniref:UBX-domain containing protein n=1 Tax=Coccidioides posadasii (strain C735) TaxID=222929 RepID=C5PAM7_COCP7|nr:UBX-domain containing protein [Coccidioides posadasii C735 delta SOWgp]EER26789.1 UBX-domain containing protein [Coccidioides posadasii C735 delta SOWgp]|eukprot:XP_003068934.1 UBX-domain containing protein [Coccidioides posadasii C735 delta SOWgp]
MSGAETSTADLSSAQQEALQTYIAVTGQEPSDAIPLLQRSEWNVQIAITKFFDGEGPDLLAETQASIPPPAPRVAQNLMNDLDAFPRPSSLTSRGLQAAPRISTQPSEPAPFRPPFLLAILFSPFNFLYRILASSLRLFGTFFPILPRMLNNLAASTIQDKGTSGRRSLGPKDTAVRFIREFEEEYGPNSLPWLDSGYNMALEKAHRELKFLLVVLLSPEHDDTNDWVRDTLLSEEVREYLTDSTNNILLWGGNVQDSEAYQVANSIRCTKFPFAALIAHTPSVSSTAMSILARIPGLTSSSGFLEKVRAGVDQGKAALDRVRSSRAEQQATRTLREQQDSAYERSLAIDRERARQRREAEAEKARLEKEEEERQAAAEKLARNLEQWKRWRAQSIPAEPPVTDKEAVRISLRLTSGERVVRRFDGHADIEELYAFVECYDILNPESKESASSAVEVTEPEGFEHKYGFRLVSPMPRIVYELAAGGSIKQRIGRGGNLLVETIDDDDSSEGER